MQAKPVAQPMQCPAHSHLRLGVHRSCTRHPNGRLLVGTEDATGHRLLYGDGFGEVAGLVDVAAAADGDVVGEELQGNDLEDGEEQLRGGGDVDGVFDELGDLAVALDGDGDDAAGAGGDLLNVAEGLLVLEDGGGVGRVLGGDDDDGEGLVDEGVGAVLHLSGGVALGVDVGDLL